MATSYQRIRSVAGTVLVFPVLAFICLAVMSALDWLWPIARFDDFPFRYLGILPVGVGLWIGLDAERQFAAIRANLNPFRDPTALVTDGLFRHSRNPMYLGIVIFLAGVALLLGSLSPAIAVGAFLVIVDRCYVAGEERRLARVFGADYAAYQTRTRRWI